jgi:lipid-A-disaccharide synthase
VADEANQALVFGQVGGFGVGGGGMADSVAPRMSRLIYLVAGEHSGDTRGAELMAALRKADPGLEFAGLGGPKMAESSGGKIRDWLESAAVMGIWEVLKRYGWFKARFEETKAEILGLEPAAVVLVDYPGFNLRLAKALRAAGTGAKLVDYISPQVWAWHRERLLHMAGYLDLMLCLFPFEQDIFEQAGLRTVWMGHPMVDQLEENRIEGGREEHLIGLFPGSREREVARLFPVMLRAAERLQAKHPEWHYEAAAASESLKELMESWIVAAELPRGAVVVRVGTSQDLMQRATSGVVASGTATMEAAYYGMPYCLVYKVAWPTWVMGKLLVEVDYIGMANIIADRQVVHEFVQREANAGNVAAFLESVMTEPGRRENLQRELLEVAAKLGEGGAAKIAAGAIMEVLGE